MTAGGLPIGLQITGRRFDDPGVLRLARLWEQLRAPLPAFRCRIPHREEAASGPLFAGCSSVVLEPPGASFETPCGPPQDEG